MFGPTPLPEAERFFTKVRVTDSCWEWTGAKDRGYGKFRVGSMRDGTRRVVTAHRWAWEHIVGPIPDGLELDHLCRNPSCCNPLHLEPVTHRVNMLRSDAPPAILARKTECLRGHEFSAENTYVRPTGYRMCRECARALDRKRRPPGTRR